MNLKEMLEEIKVEVSEFGKDVKRKWGELSKPQQIGLIAAIVVVLGILVGGLVKINYDKESGVTIAPTKNTLSGGEKYTPEDAKRDAEKRKQEMMALASKGTPDSEHFKMAKEREKHAKKLKEDAKKAQQQATVATTAPTTQVTTQTEFQHEHTWVEQCKEVDRGAYETKYVDKTVSKCSLCGANITGSESSHHASHSANGEVSSTVTETESVAEKTWVPKLEKVVSGYKCSSCGQVK